MRRTSPIIPKTGGQPIIVTASKRAERLQDVPAAITAIGSQQMEAQGVQRVADYIALVPGFASRDHGAPGYGTVILRGLNTGSFQSTATVAYYFDDNPFTATGSLSYGAFVTPDPDITDIERIEVLKGPQGTLYGASSLGGLVRLISRKPDLAEFSGSIKVDASSVKGGSEGYGIRGNFNLPVVRDKLAVRATVLARHSPGWVDNVYTGKKDHNDGNSYGGRVAALWEPSSDLKVELTAAYQDTDTKALNYTLAESDTRTPKYGVNKDSSPWDEGISRKIYNGDCQGRI
ncbi:TonB-dependent receptor [Novosphingobium colocasiae]